MKRVFLLFLCTILLVFFAGSLFAAGSQENAKVALRIASPSEGPDGIKIYDSMMAEFEKNNPGVTVTWDRSSGDDYQFQGLPSLLASDTPPDVYFEWGGNRVKNHAEDGEALDITALADEIRPTLESSAWSGAVFNGKTYMIPTNQDVTIMMWYNKDIFSKLSLTAPGTWDEFLNICAKIKGAGITPILMGNSDAWVAGNFAGLFLSRVAGDKETDDVLSLKKGTRFNNPGFIKAMQYASDLGMKGYINRDVNTLGYDPSFARLFDNSSAMYPLGTWFVTEVVPENALDPSKAHFDFFNLPAFTGGKGDQTSYMGLNTGFVANAKTKHKDLAVKFLKLMISKKYQVKFAKIGNFSSVKGTLDESSAYIRKVQNLMNSTKTVVLPPDTGYNLEMAESLYAAIAQILANDKTPEAALKAVDQKIKHLKK